MGENKAAEKLTNGLNINIVPDANTTGINNQEIWCVSVCCVSVIVWDVSTGSFYVEKSHGLDKVYVSTLQLIGYAFSNKDLQAQRR